MELIEETLLPAFEEGLADHRSPSPGGEISVQLSVHIGNPDDLVDELRTAGEYTPHEELDTDDPREIQRIANAHLEDVSDDKLAALNNVTADPRELLSTIETLEDAGVDRLILVSKVGDPRETIDAVATELLS